MTARDDLYDALVEGDGRIETQLRADQLLDAYRDEILGGQFLYLKNDELHERAEKAEAAIERVRALHVPARGGRSGYQPDDDDTPGAYGHIASACEECGSQDLAVRWPCPTIRALEDQ